MNHLWIWLQLWLQKQFRDKSGKLADYVGSFLFIKEFQGWPVVRRIRPGVLRMKAPYFGPRRYQMFGGASRPVWTGVAFAGLSFLVFGQNIPDTGRALRDSAIIGAFFALVSVPLWKLPQKTRFVIRFNENEGVMSWRGPDWKKHRIRLEEIYSPRVIAPHRWADEERRKHQNWMQSNPRQPGPNPNFQTSSELILQTGPEGSHWHTIAEFTDDAHGELANRLLRAIQLVIAFVEKEQATATKMVVVVGPL